MARKIKRFFIFLFLSLFFSLLSGKVQHSWGRKTGMRANGIAWNSAAAEGMCCLQGKGETIKGDDCCCPCSEDGPCYR